MGVYQVFIYLQLLDLLTTLLGIRLGAAEGSPFRRRRVDTGKRARRTVAGNCRKSPGRGAGGLVRCAAGAARHRGASLHQYER